MTGASAGLNWVHGCWAGALWAGGCWVVSLASGVGVWVNCRAGEGAQVLGARRGSRFHQHQLLGAKQRLPSPSSESKGWVGTQRLLPTLTPGLGFAREEDLVSDGLVSEGVGTGRGTALAEAQGPRPGATRLSHTSLCPWARRVSTATGSGLAAGPRTGSQTAPWAPG